MILLNSCKNNNWGQHQKHQILSWTRADVDLVIVVIVQLSVSSERIDQWSMIDDQRADDEEEPSSTMFVCEAVGVAEIRVQ